MQTNAMDLDARVVEVLERRGPLHAAELALMLDSHLFTVEACCARLVAAGEITTTSCGVYDRVPDDEPE
nr:hypothetical protein [Haloferax larsenii]